MKYRLTGALGLIAMCLAVPAYCADAESDKVAPPPIQVVDETGTPVAGADVALQNHDHSFKVVKYKTTDADGKSELNEGNEHIFRVKFYQGTWDAIVMAPGKVPTMATVDLASTAPLKITVKKGTPVELTLIAPKDRPLPENVSPLVMPQNFNPVAWISGESLDSHWAKKLGGGKYEITLEETTAPYKLVIHDPNYLTGYSSDFDVTAALADKKTSVTLPSPSLTNIRIEGDEKYADKIKAAGFNFMLYQEVSLSDTNRSLVSMAEVETSPGLAMPSVDFKVLAPGNYYVQVGEITTKTATADDPNVGYQDSKPIQVSPGVSSKVKMEYSVFEPEDLKGNKFAAITVLRQDGSPAANLDVVLLARMKNGSPYTMTSGTLSDKGTTVIENLSGGKEVNPFVLYTAGQSGNQIGAIQFEDDDTSRTFEFKMPPAAGDMAPDITVTDINTGEPVKLSDFRGQVVFLDFWATWCGPCQEPMAHNQKMMTDNAEAWKGKAIIVGVSIDDEMGTVIDHVKKNGWGAVRQLWGGADAWKGAAAKDYGVTGVPTAVLIDQEGKIVWRGHPAGIEAEEEIGKLIK